MWLFLCLFVCLFVLWLQVRQVSQEVLFTHNSNISLDATLSHLLVEWGQWIDHDVVHTPQSPSTTAFRTGADCTRTCSQDTPCFPIQVLPILLLVFKSASQTPAEQCHKINNEKHKAKEKTL